MTLTAVIVVTHESEPFVASSFGALARAEANEGAPLLIAVDNASRDRTVESIRQQFPSVELLVNDRNLGFAAGANRGIARAFEHGAEFVYLLNHDTEVAPGFLDEALRTIRSDPRIAAVQSLLLLDPERELVDSSGNLLHFLGFAFCRDHRRPLASVSLAGAEEIPFASGAAVLLRAEALRQVGPLDESLFLYGEDVDLGWRLRLAGWRAVLAPRSIVYHRHEFARTAQKYFLLERNRWLVLLKNSSWRTLFALAPAHLANELAIFAAAVLGGWGRQKLRAWGHLMRPSTWRQLRAERRLVAAVRQLPDRHLAPLLSARIDQEGVTGSFVRRIANPAMSLAWRLLRPLV